MVESATTRIIVDATPDFRYQMLREKVEWITAVLLTHPHKDHIAGIDDTRPFQYLQQRPTNIYGSKMSLEGVKHEIPYAFAEVRYPGVPVVNLHQIELEPFTIGDIPIIPFKVWHHKMPVHGFRFGNFSYITDANRIDESEKEKIKGSEYIVVNALRREQHISHFTLKEAVELVQELGIPKAYFTHISHQLGLHIQVNSELPLGIELAYDTMKVFI
jgi:phosphoribosyl 1,2-cyclic phosphate phosphodiesterase